MAISCDPNDLAALAKCFKCLPPSTLEQVQAYLLCQILNNGGTGGGGGGLPTGPEPANTFLAGPTSGPDATPTFRQMVTADLLTTLTPQFLRMGINVAADANTALKIVHDANQIAGNAAISITDANTGGFTGLTSIIVNSLKLTTFFDGQLNGVSQFNVRGGTVTALGGYIGLFLQEAEVAIAASDIDWSLGGIFTKTIAANTTFTFSTVTAGRVIKVVVTGDASHTVTWPAVKWAGGVAPTQTLSKVDVYTFIVANGGTIYGSAVQNMS